ncbi:MAG: CoA-binding protein, partial [Rickettsiales bacterium]|nr:CoA-binding protein [Rickettsiales bacterium]
MLENFFNPSTIAVVGVSAESNKLGSVVFNNIISAKYGGKLYAVNPKSAGQQLYGRDCIVSVRDAKEELDLVVVVVPAKFAMAVIDDCIFNKTKNVVIITAGFGEIGEHDLENEIARKCRESGINLLGPNCFGYISTFHNVNATFADGTPARGNTAFISQSGAFCAAMLDWARDKDIGFSHFISIGNKAHLSETELLEALKDDKNTKAFLFYLESIRDGQKFLRIAKEV